jgi:hypothetical protein
MCLIKLTEKWSESRLRHRAEEQQKSRERWRNQRRGDHSSNIAKVCWSIFCTIDGNNLAIAILTGADLSFKWSKPQYSYSALASFGAADNPQLRVRTASLDL